MCTVQRQVGKLGGDASSGLDKAAKGLEGGLQIARLRFNVGAAPRPRHEMSGAKTPICPPSPERRYIPRRDVQTQQTLKIIKPFGKYM